MSDYQIRLNPGESDETILTPSDLTQIGFAKTHTGFSDFEGVVPKDHNLSENVFGEVFLERDPDGDNELLFRGTLLGVETDFDGITTRLSGKGVGYRLTNEETSILYENILAHNAINDFWANYTSFAPTVTQPNVTASVTDQVAQEANTTSEFASLIDVADTVPIKAENDTLTTTQSNWVWEYENADNTNDSGNPDSNADASGGSERAHTSTEGIFFEFTFTPEYTIKKENITIAYRYRTRDTGSDGVPDIAVALNGEELIQSIPDGQSTFLHVARAAGTADLKTPSNDLTAGDTHTLRFEVTGVPSSPDSQVFDVVSIGDNRFNYTYDNDNGGSGGYLDGPQLYPDNVTVELASASTSWNITDGTLTTSWDDTSGNQRIQVRLTDQTWFPNDGTEDNTQTITADFGSEVGPALQGRATFDRYGSRTTATPQTGFNGQSLQSWEITYDGNNIPVIGSQTFEGSLFQIAQDLHNYARMRFTFGHERDSLPVESFRAGEVTGTLPSDLAIVNKIRRQNVESAYNHVTVRGQRVDGDRLKHTTSDQQSINNFGQQHLDQFDPSLETQEAVKVAARQTLNEKLKEFGEKGDIEIQPTDVQPGLSYPNQFDSNGDDLPLEETQFSVEGGSITGTLVFDFRVPALQLAEDFGNLRRDNRNSQLGF